MWARNATSGTGQASHRPNTPGASLWPSRPPNPLPRPPMVVPGFNELALRYHPHLHHPHPHHSSTHHHHHHHPPHHTHLFSTTSRTGVSSLPASRPSSQSPEHRPRPNSTGHDPLYISSNEMLQVPASNDERRTRFVIPDVAARSHIDREYQRRTSSATHRTSSSHQDNRHSDSMSSVPIVNSSTSSLPDTEIHHSPPSPNRTPDRSSMRTPQIQHNENNVDQGVEPTSSALPSRDTDDVVPPQTIAGRRPDGSPQEELEGNSGSRAQNLQSDASQPSPRIPVSPGSQHHGGHPNPSNGGSSSSSDSSRANTEGHPDDSNDPSRVNRNHPSNGPVHPMWHFHPFPPFPHPGNAPPPGPPPPPPPPPAPFVVPMVPPPIHYHAVPPLAPPTPWLPLWPTPVVPSVLLRPAVPLPSPAIVWEPGIFPMSRPVPLHVHPHIMYNPINPSAPVLQWDVVLRPEQARVSTDKGLIKRPALGDEAVIPISVQELGRTTAVNGQGNEKIDKIWIESETPALAWWMQRWGPIIIEKTNITVRDVMDAIHEYLSVPLTNEEYLKVIEVRTPTDGIRHTNGMRLRNARRLRASNGCELRSVALRARVLTGAGEFSMYRRSDLLGAHRRFMGLRPVVFADRTWKLLLGLGSGPVPKYF